jgi:hypothetical protein
MTDEQSEKDKVLSSIYKDALSPAAREIGRTLAGAIRIALSPANFIVWSFDYAAEFAAEKVKEILNRRNVPPDRVIPPRPETAAPIINALRIGDQDAVLRDLYLNLLATAMDRDFADQAHPAFLEIIKQLSPDEARAIGLFCFLEATGAPRSFPLVSVIGKMPEGGFVQALSNFSILGSEAGCGHELMPGAIDNLVRLGLSVVRYDQELDDPSVYEPLEQHSDVLQMRDLVSCRPGVTPEITRSVLEVTGFGAKFAMICTGEIGCCGFTVRAKQGIKSA